MNSSISFPKLLALVLLLDATLLFSTLGRAPLARIDEGQIAEVSREMATGHDWVTPRIGGIPWPAYPPLEYWLIASTGSVLGFSEFTVRLPTAAASIMLLGIVACMTRRWAGPEAGIAAAVGLATLPSYFVQSSFCRADVLTLCMATAAFDRFLVWAEGPRRGRDLALMYLFAALGLLAKGPLSAAILGLGGLSWFLLRKRWSLLKEMKFWIGIPALLLVVAPWYIAAYWINGWSFIHDNLISENWNAYTDGYQQKRAFYFYFKESPLLLPWLLTLLLSYRVRKAPGLDLALCWLGGIVLFFTLSSAKRINYMVYFTAPLAISAGITASCLWSESPALLEKGLWAFGGTLAAAAAVAALVPVSTWTGGDVAKVAPHLPAIAGATALCALAIPVIGARWGPRAGCIAAAACIAAGYFVYGFFVNPTLNPENREAAAFCRRVAARIPPGETLSVPAPEGADGLLHFYTGIAMPMRDGTPGFYIANQTQREHLERNGRSLQILDTVLDQRGRSRYLLRVLR